MNNPLYLMSGLNETRINFSFPPQCVSEMMSFGRNESCFIYPETDSDEGRGVFGAQLFSTRDDFC